jgi:2-polyprenyl-6-methoxyphenol hydroxylase-like FAD-dependent oxidoreductase
VSFAEVKSPYPYALMLPQSDTERLLEAHLNRLGVEVERQIELTDFEVGTKTVEARLRSVSEEEEALDVPWMIGCDGAHSAVRHGLGIPFVGDSLQSDWVLADIHLREFPFPTSEIVTYWHKKGVLAVFPISPGRYRVVADRSQSADGCLSNPTLEDVQRTWISGDQAELLRPTRSGFRLSGSMSGRWRTIGLAASFSLAMPRTFTARQAVRE